MKKSFNTEQDLKTHKDKVSLEQSKLNELLKHYNAHTGSIITTELDNHISELK